MKKASGRAFLACACMLVSGCALNSHYNKPLSTEPPPAGRATPASRATLAVTAERGNPKVLVMLALSGGGSRAAYFSSAVMLKLQRLFPDRDLLREVDVISSVSGGSMAAAYYAISKDARIEDPELAAAAVPLPPAEPVAAALRREGERMLACSQALTPAEAGRLRARLADTLRARDPDYAVRQIADLCRQAGVVSNRVWDKATVRELMTRNYVGRWIGNWFWPTNIAQYWFTSFDRSDLMAQTFADNLYDVAVTGDDLTFAQINPERPYLIINSTNATGGYSPGADGDGFPFGSIFTFTTEDFRDRISSDLSSYSIARAVMASAAFPVVFASPTLRDFRPRADEKKRYLHVFDGGNSDNLGLATLKRVLLEAATGGRITGFNHIVVISIDAFTRPPGSPSSEPDSRGDFLSFFLDTNLSSAVDALLQANRAANLEQFRNRSFTWKECDPELRVYPKRLCDELERPGALKDMDLPKRLVFYHIGFDDAAREPFNEVREDGTIAKISLTERLDRIPTSLKLSEPDRVVIDQAVDAIVKDSNPCLQAIRDLVAGKGTSATAAHEVCREREREAARK